MDREQFLRLLAEYATGGLSDEQRKQLFAAAMADQELFDALMEEDSLRELIELPGARTRLLESLAEQPAPRRSAPSPWLAWAAGLAVVFVSGAITYVIMDRVIVKEIARVVSGPPAPPKPFVPPPVAKAAPAPPALVEAPPKIAGSSKLPSALPPVPFAGIPATGFPPPPPSEVREMKVADAASAGRPAALETNSLAAPVEPLRSRLAATSFANSSVSLWRDTGDGVWVRLSAGERVARDAALAIRLVVVADGNVDILDASRRRLLRKAARAGEELELVLSLSPAQRTAADSVTLTVIEAGRSTPVRILWR